MSSLVDQIERVRLCESAVVRAAKAWKAATTPLGAYVGLDVLNDALADLPTGQEH